MHEPLLRDYSTKIPAHVFESLLLPTNLQMTRLHIIEQYLRERESKAIAVNPCIFGNGHSPRCFAAKYFDQSLHHQEYKAEIERKARLDREAKKRELADKKSEVCL